MTDARQLRVLDTGVVEGCLNIAIGQAIIESRQKGAVPDTLRFLRFPPTALVGRHQALGQELDLEFCAARDIGVVRRITGGGAIFLDPGQLGWELALDRRTLGISSLPDLTRTICEAAADGISRLGVEAAYRPRNDIEVGGRKISGPGGLFDGNTLFFQGTVLVDMDPQLMVSALRVPRAKLEKHDLDAAESRVVTLRELMGENTPPLDRIQQVLTAAFCEHFGLEARRGDLEPSERAWAEAFLAEEIGTADFIHGVDEPADPRGVLRGRQTSAGGTVTVYLRLEGPAQNRVREALVTGDFFVTPPRTIYDLESRLRGEFLEDLEPVIRSFFNQADVEVLSVSPDDMVAAFKDALQ